MRDKISVFNRLSTRILLALLVLFIVIAVVVGAVNSRNIQHLYEESYTERLLLTNALMGSYLRGEDIEYFVELMKNQDDAFKARQVDFYHEREALFELQRIGAPEEEQQEIMDHLAVFHAETQQMKNELYWDILDSLKELKEISRSTYVYVMADTGLKTRDGDALYTYIFDAEDEGEYSSPEMDGLGTSDIGNEAFDNVFITKKQTERAEPYDGDFGQLYFVCTPILSEDGDVIAILGTDLALDDMNSAIKSSTGLFNSIIIAVSVASFLLIFVLLSRSIARPLSSLTETALIFAEGNLHAPISKSALRQRTEIGTLASAFKSTLDATTLYLDSIPESLFIMNSACDTYFRNEQFVRRFGDMQARDFMAALLPKDSEDALEQLLEQDGNNTVVWIDGSCFTVMLKEIVLTNMPENSILVIANDITDLMREKENAQAAAAAKSAFLSRMSHEMRTPMNAIIGMAKVSEDSESIANIRHCISVISASSGQLLSIINDVLDMSKIESGKLELETAPMNLEKMLMKVCGITADTAEKKRQSFSVMLSQDLGLHYITDELRLSQVLTNLLSNAVKFTPEGGAITLTVQNAGQREGADILRFSVSDTGIGMTVGQISRLFNAFEQADGSIARRYGGTGLGLAISQSIVEKLGGRIEVESTPDDGATFSFAVALPRAPHQDTVSASGILPGDLKALIVENDDDARAHLVSIVKNCGVYTDEAGSSDEARALLDTSYSQGCAYDIILISYEMTDTNAVELINRYSGKLDKSSVTLITTYQEWPRIEKPAFENEITRYIARPIFRDSVLDVINEAAGRKHKAPDETPAMPDLSGIQILLVEDIDINREVFIALLENTNVATDIAENGLEAVSKFEEDPDAYDLIIMDIQMPEMDGYEATRAIRAMDILRARTVPIIAMSANAFKEDIDRCIESGMNDHLAKPIDVTAVIEKIMKYASDN